VPRQRWFRRAHGRPRPSYEDGKLRDPSIEDKQDPSYDHESLRDAVRRAVRRPRKAS